MGSWETTMCFRSLHPIKQPVSTTAANSSISSIPSANRHYRTARARISSKAGLHQHISVGLSYLCVLLWPHGDLLFLRPSSHAIITHMVGCLLAKSRITVYHVIDVVQHMACRAVFLFASIFPATGRSLPLWFTCARGTCTCTGRHSF